MQLMVASDLLVLIRVKHQKNLHVHATLSIHCAIRNSPFMLKTVLVLNDDVEKIISMSCLPESNTLHCIITRCKAVSHTLCLAKCFLGSEKNQMMPVEGQCPKCKTLMLWGDLIRLKNGCYQNLKEEEEEEMETY
ncbi:hypothetical protein LSH36_12g21087 [Paralvinella palmiformis]|uniref:Structure-specific endonuclease subunit SLX1 C-terminal domain-containing protein n=1 Tax=Paralvinella palmiformis TaxID=53620 RepID=A0AAD9NGG7_9ANNE|nr:hypothetical protein LSH36_12g21087 [Paralvinella palmiformis]